jgi:hypothetical protein
MDGFKIVLRMIQLDTVPGSVGIVKIENNKVFFYRNEK